MSSATPLAPHAIAAALGVVVVGAVGAHSGVLHARNSGGPASPIASLASPSLPASAAPPLPPADRGVAPSGDQDDDRLDREARAPATDVRLAPAASGALGAWLVVGPFRPRAGATLATSPIGVDERALTPLLDGAVGGERDLGKGKVRPAARWALVSSASGPIDLKGALDANGLTDVVAYAAGKLHVETAVRGLLLLGVDDGVRVDVDGRTVYTRDVSRPVREDDDVVPLDLSAGDHDLVLKFHQRDGAWAFRARFVEPTLAPPRGAMLVLPGTSASDATDLASKMATTWFDRAFDPGQNLYRPSLKVRFPEGAPRGVPLRVTTRAISAGSTLFDLAAGGVPISSAGTTDLVVALPPLAPTTAGVAFESAVAGRSFVASIPSRPATEQALVHVARATAKLSGREAWLRDGSLASVRFLERRLVQLLARGDADAEAQAEEARELDRLATTLEAERDPYDGRTGAMRRAVVSPLDDHPNEFGLYVPPSFKVGGTRTYPLVVALHGLNSYPMSMMRALFGLDDANKEPLYKDRHPVPLPPFEAFAVTPQAHGNTMYRELGEDDVLAVTDWARRNFPIDESRITITGPSMGGIGSAAIPFHTPHFFAAAAPLCGYHDQFIRRDVAGVPLRPWERILLEERSNVYWAENGEHLPLYIVHGTKDLPVENSGVLIDRYEKLRFAVKHEHPEVGHNVWGPTYADLKGLRWLVAQKLDRHPSHVRFKTTRTRYATSAWVTVDELASESRWAEIDARVKSKTRITFTSNGLGAVTFARDAQLIDPAAAVDVDADGSPVAFGAGEALTLHREGSAWQKGPAVHEGAFKRGRVTGPIRDVFHEPILFVYGAGPEAAANEQVARSFATMRGGITIDFPVLSDSEFLARGESLANERALFVVGRDNRVLAALAAAAATAGAPFPIRVESGAVTLGGSRITGREVGAAFVRPNPLRPDRYVVVLGGADVPGTLRATSLPDVLGDFVVWDDALAPARGQILLGAGAVRAGGFFRMDWSLPSTFEDPRAKSRGPAPKTEHEATPYLP